VRKQLKDKVWTGIGRRLPICLTSINIKRQGKYALSFNIYK